VPDRDFAGRTVGRDWTSAARLWVREGPSSAVADKVRESLARALRNGSPDISAIRAEARANVAEPADAEAMAAQTIVVRALLAPLRARRLAGRNFEELAKDLTA